MITEKDVEYAAKLAKLRIKESELKGLVNDMQNIIKLADILQKVDTEGVEPTYHVFDLKNAFREDVVFEDINREELMKNSSSQSEGYFTVLNILK